MDWESILRCPVCKGVLLYSDFSFTCEPCKKTYPIRFGIPDFRLQQPEEKELDLCASLVELRGDLSFEDLVRKYIELKQGYFSEDLQEMYIRYRLDSQERAKRQMKWTGLDEHSSLENRSELKGLDIGCGCGCGVATLLEIGYAAVGIDINMPELIIAQSFLEKFYPGHDYLLVAGVAEHLPLASEFFSKVLAIDVIEHVEDQTLFIKEAYRALIPGGDFYFDTTSRFKWIEPHTLLPAIGFLPRFLQPRYARLANYKAYNIYLPSLWELRKWLNESRFDHNWSLIYDRIDPTGVPSSLKGKLVRSVPGLLKLANEFVKHISMFRVVAHKPVT